MRYSDQALGRLEGRYGLHPCSPRMPRPTNLPLLNPGLPVLILPFRWSLFPHSITRDQRGTPTLSSEPKKRLLSRIMIRWRYQPTDPMNSCTDALFMQQQPVQYYWVEHILDIYLPNIYIDWYHVRLLVGKAAFAIRPCIPCCSVSATRTSQPYLDQYGSILKE